jgi:hypothetical protein
MHFLRAGKDILISFDDERPLLVEEGEKGYKYEYVSCVEHTGTDEYVTIIL